MFVSNPLATQCLINWAMSVALQFKSSHDLEDHELENTLYVENAWIDIDGKRSIRIHNDGEECLIIIYLYDGDITSRKTIHSCVEWTQEQDLIVMNEIRSSKEKDPKDLSYWDDVEDWD